MLPVLDAAVSTNSQLLKYLDSGLTNSDQKIKILILPNSMQDVSRVKTKHYYPVLCSQILFPCQIESLHSSKIRE